MKEVQKGRDFRFGISLRIKIVLTFFIFISVVTGLISYISYRVLADRLFTELRDKVGVLATVGGRTIDRDALRRLVDLSGEALSPDDTLEIELSADYRAISDSLNAIRDAQSDIITYVYVVVPTGDEGTARYIVDADVLAGLAEGGEAAENLSNFDSAMDISSFPYLRQALLDHVPMVERDFSLDEEFGVRSVSGYAPILDDAGSMIALLGIDMTDVDVQAALSSVVLLFLIVAGVAQVLSLLIAILLGTMFTQGIRQLDEIVKRFGDKQMDVRVALKSRDEVGRLGHSFNQMAGTIEQYSDRLERLLKAYGRFVPHDFLDFLQKDSILDVKLGDSVEREMTVLFSDIRSFTAISETMNPEENFNFINSYLKRVGPEIRSHNGFIDKYIGDAVMGLFPKEPEDAVKAGLSMLTRVGEYNLHREAAGYQLVRIGIGIHCGRLMLGTVGEEERMDSTVISDAVNLASRLESLTKFYGVTMIVSEAVLHSVKDQDAYLSRLLDRVQVVGKNEPVKIYEIYNGDPEKVRQKKEKAQKYFNEALVYYNEKNFNRAQYFFTKLRDFSPDDKLFEIYLTRSESCLKNGVPADWSGVTVFDSK